MTLLAPYFRGLHGANPLAIRPPSTRRADSDNEMLTNNPIYWNYSSMPDSPPSLNQRVAERVKALRIAQNLSLDLLAQMSGVSRSTISLIERAETSPTATVLEKLAAGLGIMLADLFDGPVSVSRASPAGPVARRKDQPSWRDPASGYLRCNVSPSGTEQPMRLVDVHFPPGARVAFAERARPGQIYQQIWMLEGTMRITLGPETFELNEGDCLAMTLDRLTTFFNPTPHPARYAIIISPATPPPPPSSS
jgi:transcriptional regulator with XRE-family HTH domain